MMKNSEAYQNFIEQLNAVGVAKKDGYDPSTIDRVFEWERNEVEDLVWEYLKNRGEDDLCELLPKLRKYEGIKALQERLAQLKVPSYASVEISKVLYDYTREKKYLNIIKSNIDAEQDM